MQKVQIHSDSGHRLEIIITHIMVFLMEMERPSADYIATIALRIMSVCSEKHLRLQ